MRAPLGSTLGATVDHDAVLAARRSHAHLRRSFDQSSSASRLTAGASDDVAEVRGLGFASAWVKHSPPKRLRNASAVAVSTRERVMAGQPQAAPLLELAERAERLGFDSVFEVSWSRINLNAFLAAGGQALSESRRQAAMSLRAQPVAR